MPLISFDFSNVLGDLTYNYNNSNFIFSHYAHDYSQRVGSSAICNSVTKNQEIYSEIAELRWHA